MIFCWALSSAADNSLGNNEDDDEDEDEEDSGNGLSPDEEGVETGTGAQTGAVSGLGDF